MKTTFSTITPVLAGGLCERGNRRTLRRRLAALSVNSAWLVPVGALAGLFFYRLAVH